MAQVASAESLQLKPRRYQQELFEDALRENVIAFLDTGSGKTLISVMLVKEKSRQLAPHLPLGAGRKVTVFLAPQVALVFQQTTVLRQHTDLRVGALCGEMGVDWWDAGRWQRQLAEHDVLVSTPQLAWVNLLCFDEAQHASKGHPYALLMKEFYFHLPPPDRPHIFGMTASPVNIRVTQSLDRIPMTIAELESTLNAKVMTVVDRSSVEAVAPPPEFIVREYTLPPPSLSIMAALQKLEAARAGLLLSAAQATQEAMLREQQVWGISAQDMACADGAAFDVTRFNSASARMARHIANVACTLQELGPWCAAAALSALLQPSTRNMYISGKREQQGADALGLADAPPMGLADAWLLPADALLPEGNSSVPRPDKKTGSESEHAALLEALRLATLAIAQLLVPDAAQLLSGLAEPSSTRAQLRAGLARCIAAVPAPLLDAHIMGTEAPPAEAAAAAAAATAAGGMLSNVTGGTSSAGAATTAAGDAAFSALMRSGSDTRQSHRSGAGGDVCSNGWHDTDDGTSCQNQAVPLKQQAAPPLQQRDYRLVTPKVTALAQTLLLYKDVALAQQPSRQSWSCIVFVTRKLAALAVDAVLRAAPGLGFLTAAPFMGYGGDTSAVSMDVKTQNATLERFKAGRLNTLVSTSVAEEGLDLKACQLVVRFDLPATPLAFVQSSGRARVLQSHMVLMLQAGNIEHIELLRSLRGYEDKMREEAALRRLDRLSVANAVDAATAAADDPEEEVPDDWWLLAGQPQEALEYCVPSTGAKVTLASAKQLVFHFCARLPSDRYAALRPRFVTEEGFVATVLLPNNSPVREVTGRLQMRRQLARASACLEACKLLHQAGALNDNLLPEARDYESGSQRKRKTSAAEQQEGESSDDEDLPAKQAKQAALPPFELQHHVPAALRLCSPAALEEAVMREDTTKFRSSTKMLHFYALSRQLAPGVTARVADEMELSRQLGLALLAPLPLLPDFTSQLSSGTEVQVRVLDLGSRELPLADVGRLQMYHRAMLHPDSLHGEAGATGSADAEDGAAAASTRRRIIRRQTAKAASAAVAAPAAELAAAAGLSGTDLAPALAPAVKLPAPTYTMPVAAAVGPGSSASTASSLARAQQHGSSWSEPGSLLAAMMAAAAGDCCASQPILQPGPQPTGVTAADGQPSGATKAAGPQNAEAQIAMPPPGRASPAQQQQAGTDTRRGTPDVAGDAPRQGVCPGGAAAAPTGESAATPPDGTSAAAPAPLAVPVPAIAAAAPAAGAVLPAAPVAGGAPGIDLSDAIGKPLDCRYVSDARWAAPLTGAWYILVPLTSAEPAAAAATTAAAAAAATATAKPAQPQMSPATEAAAGPCKAQHSQQRCTGKRAQHGVAPSATQLAEGSMPVPQALHVDWAAIKAVAQGYQEMPPELVTTGEPTAAALQALRGAVLATRYNSWRYVADDLHGSLMVDSAMPADRARAATAAREGPPPKMRKADSGAAVPAGERTFREYYRERWGEGELVPQRLLLARHASRRAAADAQAAAEAAAEGATGSAAASSAEVYLVPQLCLVHPLPRAAHSAARGVPRLMWWLGGLLTAQELLAELAPAQLPRALWPRPETVLEALTGTACQEAFSYERMEMLGDAVLKFVTCDRLFELHPGAHEGRLALRKDAVVSNVALALAGQRLRLQDRLTTPFQVKLGVAAPGSPAALAKRKEDPTVRILRAKVLADVIEALTGAFFLSGGLHAATAWLTSIGVLPPPPTAPPVRPSPPAEAQAQGRVAVEEALNYGFNNRALLAEALTHCSWPNPAVQCYQRLEFLGDAVLDLLVTRHLFHAHPGLEPGRLHDLRSASVNNERLAACAAVHRLHCPLRHFSQQLLAETTAFLDGLRAAAAAHPMPAAAEDKGSEDAAADEAGGSDEQSSAAGATAGAASPRSRREAARRAAFAWATDATFGCSGCGAPKVLADIVESLTGAVFLDSSKDLEAVWRVVEPLLQPMVCPDTVPIHPVRELNERCQKLGLEAVYATVQRHDDEEEPPLQGNGDADDMADSVTLGTADGMGGGAAADSSGRGASGMAAGAAGSSGGGPPSGESPAAKLQETDRFEEVLRRRRGLLHTGEDGLDGATGDLACHVKLTVSIAGRVVGRCRGALHKQAARMLAAQDALSQWPDFLVQLNAERVAEAMAAEERMAIAAAGPELTHKLPLPLRPEASPQLQQKIVASSG